MKKIMALMIAVVMCISMMSAVAFAADQTIATGQGGNYTVTIDSTNDSQTYTIYKIFDATTNTARQGETDVSTDTDVTTAGINYTLPTGKSLATEYTYTDSSGTSHTVKGTDWFEIDAAGNITKKSDVEDSAFSTEAFREWAKKFGTQVGTGTGNGDDIIFSELKDGYYFITTTTGSLATVTSVAPNALVKDKNQVPTVEKTEDESTNDFDDTVSYTVTVHLYPGSTKVTFHDELSAGLTLQGTAPTAVTVGSTTLAATNYTVEKWQAVPDAGDDITISFKQSYLDTITAATDVTITYSAKINSNAVVNEHNDVYLKYGENGDTESEHITVYESTFKFKVNKVDGSNNNAALSGAKFVLSTDGTLGDLTETLTDAQKATLLKFDASGNQTQANDATNYILEANNAITFNGLDGDAAGTTYYLYEVKAPDGYNKLTAPITVKITPTFDTTDTTKVVSYKVSYTLPGGTETDCTATAIDVVHEFNVQNNQGTVLPSTGGIGTTIFYIVGGLLAVGAGVVLVTKKRMGKED